MWTHTFRATTPLAPAHLWPVLADVNGWARIDHNIEHVLLEGEPRAGARFTLKPRGGPRLRFTIGAFEPPTRYSDICKLFLAEMETTHRFTAIPDGSVIEIQIVIRGPLSALWGVLVGRRHAQGLSQQTERFLHAAVARLALSGT